MTSQDLVRRAEQQATRVHARIAASVHTVTLHYPPMATPPTGGTVPTTAPVSPLTGPTPTPTVAPAETTPRADPVTVSCLWYDATALADLRRDPVRIGPTGWVDGADAWAQVDAAVGAAALRGTDYVEHTLDGTVQYRYTLLKATPLGASFGPPHSYALWLRLAER